MSLYAISVDLLNLLDEIENENLDKEEADKMLNSMQMEFEEKADSYAKCIASFNASVDAIKKEKQRLANKQKAYENKVEFLKTNLQETMMALNKVKFKTPLHSFTIQKNAESVSILDVWSVPSEYHVPQDPTIDKMKVKKDLQNGVEINGVELVQTESLRIR
jgi:hypothetical protein